MAVDDRFVYYGNRTTIRRHRLPARLATRRPPNDDFGQATPLARNAPLSIAGEIGCATRQPGEPAISGAWQPGPATRTVWYAFRPTLTSRVRVHVDASFDVFTGSTVSGLTRVTPLYREYGGEDIDAVAGQTYWIAVGWSGLPNFTPFELRLTRR